MDGQKLLENTMIRQSIDGGDLQVSKGDNPRCEETTRKEIKSNSRLPSLSMIPRLSSLKDQNNSSKDSSELLKENKGSSPLNVSDSTDIEPLSSIPSSRSERSVALNSEADVKIPNKTMDRKPNTLLANLPKKVKEEAVLRTFASNLKLASSASKTFIASTSTKHRPLAGRLSADSGRESFNAEHEDDGSRTTSPRPKLHRVDSISSVSSAGSNVWGSRSNSPRLKPWSLHMVAESIQKRRKIAALEGKKSLHELETLKEKLEHAHAKSQRLQAELDPMREKIRRYEGIIESLEDKFEDSKQEMLMKERSRLAEFDKLERNYSQQLQEVNTAKDDVEDELREEIRKHRNEANSYRKLADELEDSLAMLKESSVVDEENSPMAKQLASLRQELVKVREVLSTSEKERLNERKEKLSALQNMIKLTKAKSDIEEELDERKKADTKESSEKYMQLSGKLAVSELKLKKLRTEMSTEIEKLQKKHIDQIRELNTNHEKKMNSAKSEIESMAEKLKILEEKNRPSSPGKATPYHGRWSAMRSASRKHLTEIKEIISELEKEDLGPEKCSSDEVVRVLFTRQKEFAEKLKEAEDVLASCKNGDPRPVIQELKEERKSLKRKVEDLKQNISSIESQLKLTEMTSKRQMEDLITEKKNSFLELQKSTDDRDNALGSVDQLQKELMSAKSLLKRRQTELDMLRENLMSVTNEMKTVDADLGKTRKDLSIKGAQLERVNRDILLEKERVEQEKKVNSRLQSDLEKKRKVIKDSEKVNAELESKVQRLTENLQASQMRTNRASSERDSLKDEVQALKTNIISGEAEVKQSSSVNITLRNQIKSLEYALQEKVDKLSMTSNELEKAKANSLGVSHLLGIEEDKNKELEDEIDDLTYKLTSKNEEFDKSQERIRNLEEDLERLRSSLDDIQVNYAETETSLQSHASTRTILEKELNLLQIQHREVSREKQRLHDIVEETKRSLQQKNERIASIDKELTESKQYLKEKTRKLSELESERHSLQEEVTSQRKQNEILNESLDATKSECRKQFSELEQLRSELFEVKKRRSSLSDELNRSKETFDSQSGKDQERIMILQTENDNLCVEIKAAQTLLRKYTNALSGSGDLTDSRYDSRNEKNIVNSLQKVIQRMEKAEQDGQMFHAETEQLKRRVNSLNAELEQTNSLMSNEKVSLAKEIDHVRREMTNELEKEKRHYADDMQAANERNSLQKQEIHKLTNDVIESENRLSQMELMINEKESQLRMVTREKDQLLDSIQFLQKEIKTSDSNLENKQKEFQKLTEEKESQISALITKQKQILNELREANELLMLKDNDQIIKSQQISQLVESLKNEKEELLLGKSEAEKQLSKLEAELQERIRGGREKELRFQDEKENLELELNRMKGKVNQQDNSMAEIHDELQKKVKENQMLQRKVQQLIEEAENIGEQQCQVAEVAQVESAGMGFEIFEAEEKVQNLTIENEEMQKQLKEYQSELQRQEKLAQAKRDLYQKNARDNERLLKEVENERNEKLEALGCLKALIIDNEAMARSVNGLQETVASQKKENTETRHHLKDVLDKYEYQREVSIRTQKTFEDLMDSRLTRDHQETARLQNDLGVLRTDFQELKRERDKLMKQLENKEKELENTRLEIGELKNIMERKVINFEVEKRARELLESNLQHIANDKLFAYKRLISIEDSNKSLQGKMIAMQKRHNNLEQNLTRSKAESGPLSLKTLYEDQERREQFLKDQVLALADKFEQLGYSKHSTVFQNSFISEVEK